MAPAGKVHSDFSYMKQLAAAGFDGVASAAGHAEGRFFQPPFRKSAWKATTIGAAMGIVAASVKSRRRPALLLGGGIGTAVGLSAAAVWASRRFLGAATHEAIHRVNVVRDARWLELNPVDYA